MAVITIIGAGMMGSAMCWPARDNGHDVRLVGIHNKSVINEARATGYHNMLKMQLPEGVKCYHIEELSEAMENADLIISGVSSFGVDWFEENIVPIVPEGTPILSITKGLEAHEDGTLIPFPLALMGRAKNNISINAVGGPVTSYELAQRQQTEIAFCGKNMDELKKLKAMLETEYYHITLTTDIVGLECAVAMKNAYALGVSLAVGLNALAYGDDGTQHYNPQAALFEEGTREAMRMMQLMGGRMETLPFFTGDLYVTIFGGRTRRIGTLLGKGLSYDEAMEQLSGVTLESIVISKRVAKALRILEQRGLADTKDFPLLMHIDDIITRGEAVNIPWNLFEQEN